MNSRLIGIAADGLPQVEVGDVNGLVPSESLPGIGILIAALAMNLLGDKLRDALAPDRRPENALAPPIRRAKFLLTGWVSLHRVALTSFTLQCTLFGPPSSKHRGYADATGADRSCLLGLMPFWQPSPLWFILKPNP